MWYYKVSLPIRLNTENLANETREFVRNGTKLVKLQLQIDALSFDTVTAKSKTEPECGLASV